MLGIQTYKKGSKSAKLLQEELNKLLPLRVYRNTTKAPVKINWGSSKVYDNTIMYLNHPDYVKNVVNKVTFLKIMRDKNIPHVEFTESKEEARKWDKVVVRKLVKSYKGKGIEIVRGGEELPTAPLYTKYIPKRKEYRVIVVEDKPIIFMRKFLKKEISTHTEVRNSDNYNFLYLPDDAVKTKKVIGDIAVKATIAVDLDYCAVDIIYDLHNKEYLVLEANSAFGLKDNNAALVAKGIISILEKLDYSLLFTV